MTVDSLIFLLIVATLVALAARRLKVPYTVGLVAAGAGLGSSTIPLIVDPAATSVPFGASASVSGRKPDETAFPQADPEMASAPPLLCAIRGIGKTLDFAIDEARQSKRPLYLLFVREQPVMTSEDRKRKWRDDDEAREIFNYARSKANGVMILPGYAVSDSPADTIVDFAATVGASRLLLGAPARSGLVNLLRGNIIRQVSSLLPEDIHLLVYA